MAERDRRDSVERRAFLIFHPIPHGAESVITDTYGNQDGSPSGLPSFFAINKEGRLMNYTTAMIQLPLVMEASGERIRTPQEVEHVCADMRALAQESFQILCLNTKNRLINRHLITLGIVDASLVHPREVLRPAITESASALILIHNHPSGDPTPSAEDLRITKQLIQAGRVVDIKILDHIIIGRTSDTSKGILSMREEGLCDFS